MSDDGQLFIQSRQGGKQPVPAFTEKEFIAQLDNFFDSLLKGFPSASFVLVLPSIPDFGHINDIFTRRGFWNKNGKRFLGWSDLANRTYSALRGVTNSLKAVTKVESRVRQLYLHFNERKEPPPGMDRMDMMAAVAGKVWPEGIEKDMVR